MPFLPNANSRTMEYRMSNKEPHNDEVFPWRLDIPCSIFCGSEGFMELSDFSQSLTKGIMESLSGTE
jgi:hypothetical protein